MQASAKAGAPTGEKASLRRQVPAVLTVGLVTAALFVGLVVGALLTLSFALKKGAPDQPSPSEARAGLGGSVSKKDNQQLQSELTRVSAENQRLQSELAGALAESRRLELEVQSAQHRYEGAPFRKTVEDGLRGIESIDVQVGEVPEEIIKAGILQSAVQVMAELSFRKAGFIVSKDASAVMLLSFCGVPLLRGDKMEGAAFYITASMARPAYIPELGIRACVPVWHNGTIGATGAADVRACFDEASQKVVDEALNALLSANPGK